MNASEHARKLLRWYPAAWRRRYGEEFTTLLEDSIGEGAPSVRLRLDVMRSGVAARMRETGLRGNEAPPSEWIRSGSLAVLCGWSIFVVAGIGLQKTAEHWQDVLPAGSGRTVAEISFGAVQLVAAIASMLVVAGAAAVLPAAVRSFRAGGWSAVRTPFRVAAVTCGVTAAAFGGLVWWANRLSQAPRTGVDLAFELMFALLACASVATLTAAAVATVRRLQLSPQMLRFEGWLAEAVAACIVVMTVATCAWWAAVATSAPWFLGGGSTTGPQGSPLPLHAVVIAILMLAATVVATFGAHRVVRGTRRAT